MQGAPYFNAEFGSLSVTDPLTGVTTVRLSGSEQSAGTGLGTAGIMLGCMVSHLTQCKETSPDTPDRPMVQRAIWSKEVLPPSRRTRPDRYPHPSPFDHRTSIILNMSVGVASAVVGVYLSECAPASLRGTLMANYNVVQNVGYVLAAATVYGVVK
jgi:SP family sugar:H+ symporter-like MFS transporter